VVAYIPRYFTCPQTVNHPSSNHMVAVTGSGTHDLLILSPMPYCYFTKPLVVCIFYIPVVNITMKIGLGYSSHLRYYACAIHILCSYLTSGKGLRNFVESFR